MPTPLQASPRKKLGPLAPDHSASALRPWRGGSDALHLEHPPERLSTFTPRGADVTGDSDLGFDGIVKHAPGSGLIRRQGGQCFAHVFEQTRASKRTAKRHSADTAGSRRHFSVSPNRLSEIYAAAETFNRWLFATGTRDFRHWRSHFCEKSPPQNAPRSPVQSLEP